MRFWLQISMKRMMSVQICLMACEPVGDAQRLMAYVDHHKVVFEISKW